MHLEAGSQNYIRLPILKQLCYLAPFSIVQKQSCPLSDLLGDTLIDAPVNKTADISPAGDPESALLSSSSFHSATAWGYLISYIYRDYAGGTPIHAGQKTSDSAVIHDTALRLSSRSSQLWSGDNPSCPETFPPI